jgi:exopolyphosphatase / guanosine-5'-triphosphate,3'-diphosphate pyrophosphatase
MAKAQRLAAIDMGTNSFHLVVVEFDKQNGSLKVIDREKVVVRLGSGITDMKHLSEDAMHRGIDALRKFKIIADNHEASIRAIATSAVREALNRLDFLKRIKSELGLKVEMISGYEEARLIYLGVLQSLPIYDRQIFLIDIGGGSTEFLIGKSGEVLYSNSLKIGAIRLTQRFFPEGEILPDSVDACRKFIKGLITPVVRDLKNLPFETAVGSSGTIQNTVRMALFLNSDNADTNLNNISFTRDDLRDVIARIIDAKDVKQRRKIKGLDPTRTDIIIGGVLILEQIFERFKLNAMTVSDYALREGIILDTVNKRYKFDKKSHLDDIRYKSVLSLAQRFSYERTHTHHVTDIALKIFDQTKSLHGLNDIERLYLESAALLHDSGLFISHSQHHRHSYYLIRNTELLGYTDNEKEIIANVARYHRKSHPKPKHEWFTALTAEDQTVVRKLAAILRIADGLDRTHSSAIRDIDCRVNKKTVTVILDHDQKSPIDLEIWGAERKSGLFRDTFGYSVAFQSEYAVKD